jgi:uroporphyrinogen-III decarboxylase
MAETGADIVEGLDPPSAGGDTDLREAKRRVGARVCLKGNIDAVHVIRPGPAEQVYRTCREALEAAGPDGYILSTEQIPRDTPIEHVLAMVQARDDMAVKESRRD